MTEIRKPLPKFMMIRQKKVTSNQLPPIHSVTGQAVIKVILLGIGYVLFIEVY